MPRKQQKSFVGDFLSSTIAPGLGLLGAAIGGPVAGIVGSGIGSAAAPYLKKLKKGGQISSDSPALPAGKKGRLVKGTKAAKAHMARLRAMRK